MTGRNTGLPYNQMTWKAEMDYYLKDRNELDTNMTEILIARLGSGG